MDIDLLSFNTHESYGAVADIYAGSTRLFQYKFDFWTLAAIHFCCEFAVRPTTEKERKDFSKKDKDWFYIDQTHLHMHACIWY